MIVKVGLLTTPGWLSGLLRRLQPMAASLGQSLADECDVLD